MPTQNRQKNNRCPNLPTTGEQPQASSTPLSVDTAENPLPPEFPATGEHSSSHKRQAQANSHRRGVLSPVCQRTGENRLWF